MDDICEVTEHPNASSIRTVGAIELISEVSILSNTTLLSPEVKELLTNAPPFKVTLYGPLFGDPPTTLNST